MGLIDLNESDDASGPPPSFAVDIVFVHGLREPGLKAWTDAATGILWMRDLFPHSKYGARGLIYEYDAERLMAPGCPTANGIYDEAVSLVNHLVADRELKDAEQRPMIFLCHEFAGILIKRALAYSHSRKDPKLAHIRSIYRSTVAIMFMATPHQGFKKNALLLSHQDRNPGPSQFMLSLLEGSEALNEVTDQFAPLMKHFFIYNFWEQIRTTFGQTSIFLVDRTSAAPSWSDVDQCGINATHSGMVKFNSRTSPGYPLVLAALDQYIKLAPSTSAKRWEQDLELIRKEREHDVETVISTSHSSLKGPSQASPTSAASAEALLQSPSNQTLTSGTESTPSEHATSEGTAIPPYINVYYLVRSRSEYFVGRQRQAELLRQRLGEVEPKAGKKPKVFVIYGLPGSGKSQFCLRYLEERRNEYWGVFWIDCTTEATAEDGFASLGQRAGKGTELGAGQAWLSQTSDPWLLVLDNANDPDMDLPKFIPAAGNGHILITTRNPGAQLYHTVGSFQFRGMDPEEAITLLLRLAYPEGEPQNTTQHYRQHAGSIASELGYLALALKQAAFTIRSKLLSLERYLKSLLGCRKALLSRPMVNTAADANIIATWELPFTGISSGKTTDYRDAVDLIHIFAFMHFVSIPSSVFSLCSDKFKLSKHPRVRPSALVEPKSIQMVEDRILTAARVLYDHSIISITGVGAESGGEPTTRNMPRKYFTLHPAIHQWARERLEQAEQLTWLECTAAILEHSISTNMEMSGRTFRRLLLPHIESCMSLLESAYPGLPETHEQASHLEKFGHVYAEAGLWKKARSLQLRVVNFRIKTLGRRDPSTIGAQKSLANTYWNLFEVKHCLEVQRDVLSTQFWSRPSISDWMVWPPWRPLHVSYCATLDDLTRALWLAGLRDLSKRTGTRAVDGLMRSLGPDDPLTLSAMFNLARTYLHMNEHERSHDLLVQVLAAREHFFGLEHPDTLMTRNELGMNLCAQRVKLFEAERLVRGVLESRRRVLGEEHPYTLWSVNDLSKVCCELRRFDEAREMLEEIVPVVRRTLGDEHVGMIMTKSNLSRVYILCNMWESAGELIRELRQIIPVDHPDWIHAEWGHAFVLLHYENKPEEAEKCCTEILSRVFETRVLAPDNARVIATAELLLQIYQEQRREDEIVELKEKFPQLATNEARSSIDHLPLPQLRRRRTDESRPPRVHAAATM